MKKIILILGAVTLSLLLSSCSIFGKSGVENLEYKVLEKSGKFEVRQYKSYISAKTFVEGENYKEVQNKAFRILAGYIFGGNTEKKDIAMTAPVLNKEDKKVEGEQASQKIAMTAPVLKEKTVNGWSMAFSMPSKYSLKDLPTPNSDKIIFEEIPAKKFATVRYSGVSGVKVNNLNTKKLKKWILETERFEMISTPIYAGYNPPWTLPFFRRNEILIEIKDL